MGLWDHGDVSLEESSQSEEAHEECECRLILTMSQDGEGLFRTCKKKKTRFFFNLIYIRDILEKSTGLY